MGYYKKWGTMFGQYQRYLKSSVAVYSRTGKKGRSLKYLKNFNGSKKHLPKKGYIENLGK